MNTTVKLLIGATIGAGLGWFVGAVIADIIDLKEHPWTDTDYDDIDPEDGPDELPAGEDEPQLMQRPTEMAKNKTTKKNYSEIFARRPDLEALVKKYNGADIKVPDIESDKIDGMEPDVEIDDEWNQEDDNDMPPNISIISMSEFANAEGYETMTLNFYDDDVVTDEHDNPISHPEQILGEEALTQFGVLSEDHDVVYVRNLAKKAMYEIVRTNKNYAVQKARRARKQDTIKRLSKKEEDDGEDNAE